MISLQITIVDGHDLAPRDEGSLSNPYIKVLVNQELVFASSTKEKNLNPVWNEGKVLGLASLKGNYLLFQVFDENSATKDQLIGEQRLNLSTFTLEQLKTSQPLSLTLIATQNTKRTVSGSVNVKLQLVGNGNTPEQRIIIINNMSNQEILHRSLVSDPVALSVSTIQLISDMVNLRTERKLSSSRDLKQSQSRTQRLSEFSNIISRFKQVNLDQLSKLDLNSRIAFWLNLHTIIQFSTFLLAGEYEPDKHHPMFAAAFNIGGSYFTNLLIRYLILRGNLPSPLLPQLGEFDPRISQVIHLTDGDKFDYPSLFLACSVFLGLHDVEIHLIPYDASNVVSQVNKICQKFADSASVDTNSNTIKMLNFWEVHAFVFGDDVKQQQVELIKWMTDKLPSGKKKEFFESLSSGSDLTPKWQMVPIEWINPIPQALNKALPLKWIVSYQDIENILLFNDCDSLYQLTNNIQNTKMGEVSDAVVSAFYYSKPAVLFTIIKSLISREVFSTGTLTNVFRRNSIASKILTLYSKKVANNYLRNLLAPVIKTVCSEKPLEIEPDSSASAEEITQNLSRLKSFCSTILNNITASVNNCPFQIRLICYYLKGTTEVHFSGDDSISILSGFFFLRLVSPAILAASELGVPAEEAKSASRSLLLIAKVIQTIANGLEFLPQRDDALMPLNEFVKESLGSMRAFLSSLADVSLDLLEQLLEEERQRQEQEGANTQREMSLQKIYGVFSDFLHIFVNSDQILQIVAPNDIYEVVDFI